MILNYQLERDLEEGHIKFYYLIDELDNRIIPGWSIDQKFLCYSADEIEDLNPLEITIDGALELVLTQDSEAYVDKWGFISSRSPDFWGE